MVIKLQNPKNNLAIPTSHYSKIINLLSKCTAPSIPVKQLLQIHAQVLTNALAPTNFIAVKLIAVCGAHAKLRHADHIFAQLHTPNVFAWNTLLKSYADNNSWATTIHLFNQMQLKARTTDTHPDEYSFTSLLKACSGLSVFFEGKKIHALLLKNGFDSNLCVRNSLVDLYFKSRDSATARQMFDEMPVRDVVSWNTLVSGYSFCGDVGMAREVFDTMPERSIVSWSAMVAGYTRWGDTDAARELFDMMPWRNVVSWNTMIAGYAQNEKFGDAIELFRLMQKDGVEANDATLVSVLSACAHLGALDLGKWIDRYIERKRMGLNLFLGNALCDMYAKCGRVENAREVFDKMSQRDVISWTVIISGLAMHGYADRAFMYFSEMLEHGVEPNEITFMGLLSACTHAGLIDEGLKYFDRMQEEYKIEPKVEHYGCVVDLLSRAGRLEKAEELIDSMPMEPNAIVWGALLGGCRIHGDTKRGMWVVQRILELDPKHSGSYVYLSIIYSSLGWLDDAAKCRIKMRENGVFKTPGCSWIEVDNKVHEFFVGDRSHPQANKIYQMINELGVKMKLAGYAPNTTMVSHSIEEEEKADSLTTHSEKLAIAFGLISTSEGTPIRIVKNLRICNDCHAAVKIISRIVGREIIVRDRSRFHLFKEGSCSCNDYW